MARILAQNRSFWAFFKKSAELTAENFEKSKNPKNVHFEAKRGYNLSDIRIPMDIPLFGLSEGSDKRIPMDIPLFGQIFPKLIKKSEKISQN